MLFKLSLKNIKKSIKDYSIYFFTLVVAVAIFYIFNSLDSQTSMLMIDTVRVNIVENLVKIIGYLSIFVSMVLGFLIIYSNNFIIKRRKKEIGLYFTLGMSKRKVSMILVIETLIIGIVSLAVGLFLGVFLSQFFSIITAKLFEVDMTSFKFVFSSSAFYKTIIYFGIIFILVMIFNIISLSRYKLIDLLNANKKNEKIKFRNKWVILISFILSIILIAYAYKLLFSNALVNLDSKMLVMIIAGALATFLFFFSLSGFLLTILQKTKLYYRELNMFTLKQINNKVNTTIFSTTIICLMLLFTIGILAGSISLSGAFNNDFVNSNVTDFTLTDYPNNCIVQDDGSCKNIQRETTIKNIINKDYFNKAVANYVYYNVYESTELPVGSFITTEDENKLLKEYGNDLNLKFAVDIISETTYNNILKLYGKTPISLESNEYLLTANIDSIKEYFNNFLNIEGTISINNMTLTSKTKEIEEIQLVNYSARNNSGTIVVDDSLINNFSINKSIIIGNYKTNDDLENIDESFINNIENEAYHYNTITKLGMRANGIGLKVLLTFVGLYLGIIFSIASVTVLAIGQLSESSDNKERYKVLRQLGANDKMINKALLIQIAVAFLLPLVVALIHAFFGLRELTNLIKIFASIDLTKSILLTALFIVIVYGGYFLATYLCSKRIIKEQ